MSAMSDLHLTSAMSLVYGKAIESGHDDSEAMAISRFPDNDVLTEFGITQDDIAMYADFLVSDYDWDDYDGDIPAAVESAQGLLFDAESASSLWADAFEDEPPF